MKNRGARSILASCILAAAVSAQGQETAGGAPEKKPEVVEKAAGKPSGAEQGGEDAGDAGKKGAVLERLSPGPAPRLKAPAPKGPDTLDLLPTDPESVVRNKLLPLEQEAPELADPVGAVGGLKNRAMEAAEKIKRNRTEEATDEMALRVRFRQSYTRALRDGEVQQYWEESKRARTDSERREFLKKYYTRLYGLMRKADKNLTARIDREEKDSLRFLTQSRVESSVPPGGDFRPSVAPPADPGF
jgi:hypothetical protein